MKQLLDAFIARPLWQKVAIWVGTTLLVVYLMWQFLLKSQIEAREVLIQKIESLNSSITQEQRIARELKRFREEVKALEIKLKFALQELPDEKETEGLLTSISNLARDTGLTVHLFKPKPEAYKEFYVEVPVDISVEGTYHQIASFFDEVAHLPRIVNINQISIKDPKVTEQQVSVKADCVATTFRYLDESQRVKAVEADDGKRRRRK